MAKQVSCINAGYEDCAFLIRSENEEELITFVEHHAEQVHGTPVSREHVERIMIDV